MINPRHNSNAPLRLSAFGAPFFPAVNNEEAAARAGLRHLSSSDHYDLALEFFNEPPASPPPMSLGHLMGPRMLELRNHAGEAVNQGLISPVWMTFQVP